MAVRLLTLKTFLNQKTEYCKTIFKSLATRVQKICMTGKWPPEAVGFAIVIVGAIGLPRPKTLIDYLSLTFYDKKN